MGAPNSAQLAAISFNRRKPSRRWAGSGWIILKVPDTAATEMRRRPNSPAMMLTILGSIFSGKLANPAHAKLNCTQSKPQAATASSVEARSGRTKVLAKIPRRMSNGILNTSRDLRQRDFMQSKLAFARRSNHPIRGMPLLPKRTSLVTSTAETLKKWIMDGDLSETLPGELRLKSLLGVSRNTLRQALKLLADEHWLSSTAQGKQRCVVKDRLPTMRTASDRRLPVTFLSPFPTVDRIILLEMEDLQMHLAEQGRELRFIAPNIFNLKRPERHLKRLVAENPSSAWILHFVTESVQRWFEQQGVPAFIYGSPYPGVNLAYVVNDWESAAFHAGLQLRRNGHERIAMLAYAKPVPGVSATERGLRRALAAAKPDAELLVLTQNGTPQSVVKTLESAFLAEKRPTALVFCSSSHLLTCFSWLISKGMAVPADVSVVCIPSDSWFQELYPPVCHYTNNPHLFAHHIRKRVMELVDTGRVIGPSIRVRLEYKPGATIGPSPQLVPS